jgi:hypothetical protein
VFCAFFLFVQLFLFSLPLTNFIQYFLFSLHFTLFSKIRASWGKRGELGQWVLLLNGVLLFGFIVIQQFQYQIS